MSHLAIAFVFITILQEHSFCFVHSLFLDKSKLSSQVYCLAHQAYITQIMYMLQK